MRKIFPARMEFNSDSLSKGRSWIPGLLCCNPLYKYPKQSLGVVVTSNCGKVILALAVQLYHWLLRVPSYRCDFCCEIFLSCGGLKMKLSIWNFADSIILDLLVDVFVEILGISEVILDLSVDIFELFKVILEFARKIGLVTGKDDATTLVHQEFGWWVLFFAASNDKGSDRLLKERLCL